MTRIFSVALAVALVACGGDDSEAGSGGGGAGTGGAGGAGGSGGIGASSGSGGISASGGTAGMAGAATGGTSGANGVVLLAFSDWSAGEWTDGGHWGKGQPSGWAALNTSVVPIAVAGLPSQALRVVCGMQPNDSWIEMTLFGGNAPAYGQPVTIRWYERITAHDPNDPGHHGIALGTTNGTNPWFTHETSTDSYVVGMFLADYTEFDNVWAPFQATGRPLKMGEWHRIEWTTTQESATTMRMAIHVYDMNNNPVVTPSDFEDIGNTGSGHLGNHQFGYDLGARQTQFTGFLDGFGPAGGSCPNGTQWGEFAAVAIALGDYVGPYDPVRGF